MVLWNALFLALAAAVLVLPQRVAGAEGDLCYTIGTRSTSQTNMTTQLDLLIGYW
ncbi:uncharacterized protein BDV17DRAFT_254654 [Aspergillus undulatus]|uniref:uncharacterized protein n=1 Tax=Aspergillus undulatus TaxID=1810928 RepID=UPI003CCD056B